MSAHRRRLRARLRRIRESLQWISEETTFYNLDNYRNPGVVKAELEAIALHWEPGVLALCEVIGNELPGLPGYRLVRDQSTRSRQNIAAYIRDDLPLNGHHWVDLHGTWPRTEGPGVHEARSYLVLHLGRMQHPIAHQPPKNARNAWTLQQEGINALARVMAPWKRREWRTGRPRLARVIARLRPRLLVWDANRRAGENGPGPDQLATRTAGWVHGGQRIDSAVSRGGIRVKPVTKSGRVGGRRGVNLASDHRGAIRVRWAVRSYWLPTTIKEK